MSEPSVNNAPFDYLAVGVKGFGEGFWGRPGIKLVLGTILTGSRSSGVGRLECERYLRPVFISRLEKVPQSLSDT